MSESEEWTEVLVDLWTETHPKAGGGLWPFLVDSVDEEDEEEAEPDLFRSVPSSVAEVGRESRGCGTGNGF